jgi:hypothetical protein
MLGNKNCFKQCKTSNFSKKILFLFFSTFTRFPAAILQNFRSDLRATYTLNCTEKTYAKRLLSELLTQQQNLQTKKTMKKEEKKNLFVAKERN